MIDSSNRRIPEPAVSASQSKLARIVRICLGGLTVVIGGSLASIMAFAMFHEFLANDFFGVCVTGMVVVFGLQLVKIGYDLVMNRQKLTADSDPLDELWKAETRVYLYLPYSQMEIRGR